MSGYKPQTSDALMNDRILRARQAESRNLRYQGQADYASKVAQKRATDLELSKGYSEARNKIANMNLDASTQAANQRVQLKNLVAGQSATNLDTFISRWQSKKQQDDLANKSLNQQMALSDIDTQMAEVYSAPIDTSTRDFYTNEAGKVMSWYKPQTSDALMNDRILRARQAESRNLRYQGQADYASKVAQKRATDLELSKRYSEARNRISNMNLDASTQAANQRVQLKNLVAGQSATNLDTFISRWQAKKQQDDLANKSLNQQMALSDIDTQMNTDMQSLQSKMNLLMSKEQTPEVVAQRAKLNEQYSKIMGLKKQASYSALKNPNTKFDYMAAKQQAGITAFKKGGSLVNYITRLDRFNERQISKINSNMDKKYLMNVKNNLEILKEILKGK